MPKSNSRHSLRSQFAPLYFVIIATLCLCFQLPSQAATFTVTTTADSGAGSLRAAITDANASAGVTDSVNFAIGSGEQTITVGSALPDITDTLTIDGSTQPGFPGTPIVVLRPSAALTDADGLRLTANGCTVKALAINGFTDAIEIASTNNRVQGCYLGVNAAGTAAESNATGIHLLMGADSNTIGGTTAGARNVIAGGISIEGGIGNTIAGNYIGTNAAGSAILGTGGSIFINTSTGNIIGGTVAGARNVIVGSIWMSAADSNVVQGNYIGTNATGNAVLGNGGRVTIFPGFGNLIGGTAPGARNVIAGSVSIEDSFFFANGNTIQGNYIGVNADGTAALRSLNSGSSVSGIMCRMSNNTLIGGTTAAARNVIAGHSGYGILIDDAEYNTIQGNYIGTNATGTAAIGNGLDGIRIIGYGWRSKFNKIGGTVAGAGNLISGNTRHGVFIDDIFLENWEEASNTIQGNYIGTNAAGTAAIGNGGDGVRLEKVTEHTVGGTASGARNIISGNGGNGIYIADADFGVQVQGNYIGLNAAGTAAIGNGGNGINCLNTDGIIGGTTAGARNIISGNAGHGIFGWVNVQGTGFNLPILGNYIGTNPAGAGALGNGGDGIRFTENLGYIGGIGAGQGNRIAFNGGNGVNCLMATTVRGNAIFDNGKLGIDIGDNGVTLNDGDGAGSDGIQDFPQITGVVRSDGTTTIAGVLQSRAELTYLLDFYYSLNADPSGYGEGQVYLGSTSVVSDAMGKATFSFSVAGNYAGRALAATATSQGQYFTGPTSEFSRTLLRISGRVATSDGTGVAGVYVTRTGSIHSTPVTVQTDTNGNYLFTDVPPDSYVMSAARSGYTFAPSGFREPGFPNSILLQSDQDNVDFIATPTVAGSANISGRVANHSGVGIARVLMRLTGGRQVETDSNGNYVLTNIPSGSYVLEPVITPALSGVRFTPARIPLTVGKTNIYNQNFFATFTLSGRVSNHSGAGIPFVLVTRSTGASATSIYTDANGNYKFYDVRSGTYTIAPTITVAMTGMSFTPTSRTATVDRSNVFNQNFIGMFSVSGRVTTSAGAGVVNVLMRLSNGSTSTTVLTDNDGNYRFSNVRSGTYSVTPTQSGRTFTPTARSGITVDKANVLNQNFTASG